MLVAQHALLIDDEVGAGDSQKSRDVVKARHALLAVAEQGNWAPSDWANLLFESTEPLLIPRITVSLPWNFDQSSTKQVSSFVHTGVKSPG